MQDTKTRYGFLSRLLHWGMAFLIAWQFMKFFDRINEGEHWIGENLASWHVSIGSLILLFILFRLFWAIKQKNKRPQPDAASRIAVKAGHGLLYLGMLVLPITGVMIMIGKGYGLDPFGIELVAGSENEIAWMAAIGSIHSLIAWALLILVAGHIAMALYHRFVKKDDVMQRML